jgi:hypothetical protein
MRVRGHATKTAPARATSRGRSCQNCRPGWGMGARRTSRSSSTRVYGSACLFGAISLGLRRLRPGMRRVADGLGQHLIQLGLGLLRITLEGSLLRFDHKQYVGMPEGELNHEGEKSGNKRNLQSGTGVTWRSRSAIAGKWAFGLRRWARVPKTSERSFYDSYLGITAFRLFLSGPIIRLQWQLIEHRLVAIFLICRAWNGDIVAVIVNLN